jgi:hypothetical protein
VLGSIQGRSDKGLDSRQKKASKFVNRTDGSVWETLTQRRKIGHEFTPENEHGKT